MPVVKAFAKITITLLKPLTDLQTFFAGLATVLTLLSSKFIKVKAGTTAFGTAMDFATKATKGFIRASKIFAIALLAFEALGYIWNKIFPSKEDTDDATQGISDLNKELTEYNKQIQLFTIGQIEDELEKLRKTSDEQTKAMGQQLNENLFLEPVDLTFEPVATPEPIKLMPETEFKVLQETIVMLEKRLADLTGTNLDFSKAQAKVRKEMDKLKVSMREYNTDGDIQQQRLANELMDRYGININDVKEAQKALKDELEDFIVTEGKSIGLNQIARLEKRIAKVQGVSAAQMFLNEQAAKGVVISTEHADRIRELNALFEKEKELKQLLSEEEGILSQVLEKTTQTELKEIDTKILKLEKIAEEIGLTNELAIAIHNLKVQKEEVEDLDGKTHKLSIFRNKAEKDSTVQLLDALGLAASQHKEGAKVAARLSQLSAIINTYEAFTAALKTPVKAAAILVSGLAAVAQIENSMGKMGAGGGGGSKPTGPGGALQFEDGGYVGGRRHSEGGTLIEAERGEFVMSRRAVESIGLETLNQMNRGGGTASGNVVINVSGNVMTQDFVEGELAEQIKEAVRRGSDFGIG